MTDEFFQQEVLASAIPVVVDFWSPVCPPCQVMSGLLSEIGPDYAGRVNIFKLRVDQNPMAAAHFQIRSVPTLIFFRGGKIVGRVVGLLPLHPLQAKIDELIK
ncbi:MAG: thioredoxin fold domain-containing protein [candidate division Zixibacteria bacterium]|nr:thioredoxin fold domain-containing protein [candidate division Zixibacteria bacterium]